MNTRATIPGRDWAVLAAVVVGCQLIGGLGAVTTVDGISEWYAHLIRPAWTPPNWLFGPVWTTLYAMMAVAAWRVWRQRPGVGPALRLFGVQLALNAVWSPIFFGARAPLPALLVIVAMLVAIALTIRAFARHDRTAAWLLAPYLAWVSYATTLNAGIWWLN
jgi:benzodiazapine receptor